MTTVLPSLAPVPPATAGPEPQCVPNPVPSPAASASEDSAKTSVPIGKPPAQSRRPVMPVFGEAQALCDLKLVVADDVFMVHSQVMALHSRAIRERALRYCFSTLHPMTHLLPPGARGVTIEDVSMLLNFIYMSPPGDMSALPKPDWSQLWRLVALSVNPMLMCKDMCTGTFQKLLCQQLPLEVKRISDDQKADPKMMDECLLQFVLGTVLEAERYELEDVLAQAVKTLVTLRPLTEQEFESLHRVTRYQLYQVSRGSPPAALPVPVVSCICTPIHPGYQAYEVGKKVCARWSSSRAAVYDAKVVKYYPEDGTYDLIYIDGDCKRVPPSWINVKVQKDCKVLNW